MANLIDATFFVRDITIPNISITNPRNAPNLERLQSFINKYEPEVMEKIFGYEFYKLIMTETSQRITDLKNGVEYTDFAGNLRKWKGLVYDTDNSLIAYYVYVKYQESATTQTTGVSTAVMDTEGGKSVSPADKIVDAWNCFSTGVKDLVSFIWNKNTEIDYYPEISNYHLKNVLSFSRRINVFGI